MDSAETVEPCSFVTISALPSGRTATPLLYPATSPSSGAEPGMPPLAVPGTVGAPVRSGALEPLREAQPLPGHRVVVDLVVSAAGRVQVPAVPAERQAGVVERRLVRLVVADGLDDLAAVEVDHLQRLVALPDGALALAAVGQHAGPAVR